MEHDRSTFVVLHVAQPLAGGVPVWLPRLVEDQVSRGWSVAVACPSKSQLAVRLRRTQAAWFPWEAEREPTLSLLRETRGLNSIVERLEPDVVHLHSSKAGLAGRLALRGRWLTVFQPNGWSFSALDGVARRGAILWERMAARWTDAIVCVSDSERLRGERVGISANWRVIPNGADLDMFTIAEGDDRDRARTSLGLDDSPLVVCVGRLSRQKGQDILIAVWPRIRQVVPHAKLALVGDGPDRARLEAMANSSVIFAGERTDVADWLAAADVVAMPSRWEGMSFVMLEAMARGRSIVTFDVEGAREALGGVAGAIVPVGADHEFAEAVASRLLDPRRADAEGRKGRIRAERSHDLRLSNQAIVDLYEELGSSARRHARR